MEDDRLWARWHSAHFLGLGCCDESHVIGCHRDERRMRTLYQHGRARRNIGENADARPWIIDGNPEAVLIVEDHQLRDERTLRARIVEWVERVHEYEDAKQLEVPDG